MNTISQDSRGFNSVYQICTVCGILEGLKTYTKGKMLGNCLLVGFNYKMYIEVLVKKHILF